MRPCKLLGWGRDLTLAMLWILKTIKIRTIKYNICPSVAGSFFYKSFTLLNGSSHQTLNVLHLRFIFTSQLHKAGIQCCKALLDGMLACWGGEHCQMCPVEGVWKVSAPASDIDICVQCLGLCQMRDSDNAATVRLTRGWGTLSWAQHLGDGLVTNKINQHQRYVCSVQCNRDLSCWTFPVYSMQALAS